MEIVKDGKSEESKEQKKLTYEQLEQVATQLSQQSRQLYSQLQQANLTNTFKRMDYLFKVIQYANKFDADFVNKCTKELVDFLTMQEESEESEESEVKE
jgi:alpha-L-arabinofuranosidase